MTDNDDTTNQAPAVPFSTGPDNAANAPYPRFGENPNLTTPPLPVPGYPQNDVPPGSVTQVPNVHDQVGARVEAQFQRDRELEEARRINADLLARLERLEKTGTKPADNAGPIVGGGAPDPHHLHLVDGRVIENHGGIGTHYSETLPDGSSKVTRIREFYRADEPDPSSASK